MKSKNDRLLILIGRLPYKGLGDMRDYKIDIANSSFEELENFLRKYMFENIEVLLGKEGTVTPYDYIATSFSNVDELREFAYEVVEMDKFIQAIARKAKKYGAVPKITGTARLEDYINVPEKQKANLERGSYER